MLESCTYAPTCCSMLCKAWDIAPRGTHCAGSQALQLSSAPIVQSPGPLSRATAKCVDYSEVRIVRDNYGSVSLEPRGEQLALGDQQRGLLDGKEPEMKKHTVYVVSLGKKYSVKKSPGKGSNPHNTTRHGWLTQCVSKEADASTAERQ